MARRRPGQLRELNRANRKVEARSRGMVAALTQWLGRFGRLAADQEIGRVLGDVAKADPPTPEELERQLSVIFDRFGLAQLVDSGSETLQTRWVIPPSVRANWIASKTSKIRLIVDETRRSIQESVRQIMLDAEQEEPRPTAGELARRIRMQFHGPVNQGSRIFTFSPERAENIARTELAEAQNVGAFEGLQSVAAEEDELEWLAYSDGRSGNRFHNRMNGKRVKVGELFRTPLGNSCRYPNDPRLPVADKARCRCSFRLVRSKR
jgi:hypothetical protein